MKSLFIENVIMAAMDSQTLGLEDAGVSSLAPLYFQNYKPKLTLYCRT